MLKTYEQFIQEEFGMGDVVMPDCDNNVVGSGDIPDNMLSPKLEDEDIYEEE